MSDSETKPATVIDGLIAVETPDTSGEVLVVKGCNIETLEVDGVLNYEHQSEDKPGASFNDIVGKCIKAKKIFSAKDCSNERELYYWKMFELPMIYGQFRLFDGAGHPGAIAAAAIMKDQDREGEPQTLRFSIEGSTVKRDGNRLEETIARCVALTRKPANHAAVTGILKGKTKPKTLLDEITEDTKKFDQATGYERLGGVGVARLMPLNKTYTATMGDGGLTAPAGALQVEHLDRAVKKELNRRKLLTVVKSILRDSNSIDEAKAAIKHELGDMSPEFVNLFDKLADEWRVRKSQEMFLSKGTDEQQYKATLERLSNQGATLPPKETMGQPYKRKVKKGDTYFDENNGVLYTPKQAFKMYIPVGDSQYEELLEHPDLQAVHDTALKNWVTLHRLYRSGQLPDEVPALAGLFSAQSPNTDVPTQELAYAHWMDLMGKGFDPREPEDRYGEEFKRRAASREMPETDAELFGPGAPVRTVTGLLPKIGLSTQKVAGAMSYGQIHGIIKELLSQGKSGREISGTINGLKHRNFLAAQRGDKTAGGEGKGFAPKTIRYLLGMAGIGDVLVPDTHFIRHSFGLHVTDPANYKLKEILWDAKNEPAVAAMDRYYYKNHPAVNYTRNRLKKLGVGEDFGEHLIFPSFWAHWLSVAPHERLRGWSAGQASNEGTDHAVFFNSVARALKKRGIPFHVNRLTKGEDGKESMPARIADAVHEIEQQWGPELAQFAFYSHMVPALLANSHHLRKMAAAVDKLESLAKTAPKPVPVVVDADTHGLPGLAHHPDQRALIHGLDLEGQPQPMSEGMKEAAAPGIDETAVFRAARKKGLYSPRLLLSPSGKIAFVKPNIKDDFDGLDSAKREAAFHALARDYFGMGAYVPTTAAFQHPNDSQQHLSAQEFIPHAGHRHDTNVMEILGHSGALDKAAILDTILGNGDRHNYNFLTSSVPPYLHLIDNGFAFTDRQSKQYPPEYLTHYSNVLDRLPESEQVRLSALHPQAQSWLMAMNPKELEERMHALGVPGPHIQESVRRLKEMQARVRRGPVTKTGIITAPFWG